jgi:hypothetical protein
MKNFRIAMGFVLATIAPVAAAGWPPEPLIEMRVPVAPSAFPSAGRNYLVYERRRTR